MENADEGGVAVSLCSKVFYNPHMRLCRSLSALCVGAIGETLSVLDAMCATGVRGLRYRKENRNVSSLALVDWSKKAAACARKNAKANRIKCRTMCKNACTALREGEYDFVELDPFGSPAPFLYDAACCLAKKKRGWLSVTATDMAVLCGAEHSACLRNYWAAPLDNEFCHENAARILAGKAILTFAQFNLCATPIFTLSHRHYLKMVFGISRGAPEATAAVKSLCFLSYCPGCCYRETARIVRREKCPHCGHQLQFGGPLYSGALWNRPLLKRMLALNARRGLPDAKECEKMLRTMLAESAIPSYAYYDLHTLAKKMRRPIKSMDSALLALKQAGFSASRTHFSFTAVRTDAPHEKILGLAVG